MSVIFKWQREGRCAKDQVLLGQVSEAKQGTAFIKGISGNSGTGSWRPEPTKMDATQVCSDLMQKAALDLEQGLVKLGSAHFWCAWFWSGRAEMMPCIWAGCLLLGMRPTALSSLDQLSGMSATELHPGNIQLKRQGCF